MKTTRTAGFFTALALTFCFVFSGGASASSASSSTDPSSDASASTSAASTGAEESTPLPPVLREGLLGKVEGAPAISSEAAFVVEANTGQVVFSKNPDEKHYPASVTKIMTALLAFENGNLDDVVTASSAALNHKSLTPGGSSAGILPGEELTLRQLLECLLIPSANEAACVIGEYIAGSVGDFVDLMNERAKELGCTNTHFANPHGLHDDDHYTTARDLYKIAAEFAKHPELMEIANMTSVTLPATNKSPERTLVTTNHLITTRKKAEYYYEYARGIKTGYTSQARHTLVSTAQKDGLYFISVVMDAPVLENNVVSSFIDSKALYEWAFGNFRLQTLVKSGQAVSEAHVSLCAEKDSIVLETKGEIKTLLPKDGYDETKLSVKPPDKVAELTAPVEKGMAVSKAEVYYDGVDYGSVDLIAASSAELSNFMSIGNKAGGFFGSPLFVVLLSVIGAVVVGYVVFVALSARKRKRRRQSRGRYR